MESRLVAVLLVGLASSACGGGGGGGGDSSLPVSDLPGKVQDNTCAQGVACGQYPDTATCMAASPVGFEQLLADVNAGKTKYDAAAAAKCLAAGGFVSCKMSERGRVPSPPECEEMFKGTIADGAPCFTADECVSRACDLSQCDGTQACCMGTCAPTVARVALGGDCSAPAARCAAGSCLTATDGTATCVAVVAEGQPCMRTGGDICTGGTFCIETSPGSTYGVCAKAPATGASCASFPTCDSSADYCDATMTCAPKIAVGAACPSGRGCVDYAFCAAATMTCVRRPAAGEACDATMVRPCQGILACTGGVCVSPPPTAACT